MNHLRITDSVRIPLRDIDFSFVRSSGPGGQNVNKVATACQLRFDVSSASLPREMRARLLRLARNRINSEGILIIDARRHRTRERNRQDALRRLVKLLQQAAHKPVPRIATRPPAAADRRRLEEKRQRSRQKQLRGRVGDADE